jgi:hypothetical protein
VDNYTNFAKQLDLAPAGIKGFRSRQVFRQKKRSAGSEGEQPLTMLTEFERTSRRLL